MFAANITAEGGGVACEQSCLFMFRKRIIKLIERRAKEPEVVHVLQPCLHRAVQRFIFSLPQSWYLIVILAQVDTSSLLSSLCDFHELLCGDTASFLPKLFLKQK